MFRSVICVSRGPGGVRSRRCLSAIAPLHVSCGQKAPQDARTKGTQAPRYLMLPVFQEVCHSASVRQLTLWRKVQRGTDCSSGPSNENACDCHALGSTDLGATARPLFSANVETEVVNPSSQAASLRIG